MATLAIIIVSWNTRDLLRRCIATVHTSLAGADIVYEVVVVDNASSDGTPAMLRAEHPEVTLIEAGGNLGFAGGNNLALRLLLGRPKTRDRRPRVADHDQASSLVPGPWSLVQAVLPDYILLLNPDTEVLGDAIARMARYLDAHPDVAVAGPRLRYPDGSAQPSRRRFPTRGVYFWESTPLERRWPANPWVRRYRYADAPDDAEQAVDWLVGAALLVRSAAIERAGLLDAGFAMYSEELEWQRRIRGLGRATSGVTLQGQSQAAGLTPLAARIVYLPDAVIVHHEGQSSAQAPARRYLNFQRSRLRDARMVYGARFAATLRLFLRVAYAAELATEIAKWLLGHKRPLRAQRIKIYWRVACEL